MKNNLKMLKHLVNKKLNYFLEKRKKFIKSLNENNKKIYFAFEFFLKLLVLATPLYLIEWLKPSLWFIEFPQAVIIKNLISFLGYNTSITTIMSNENIIPLLDVENTRIRFAIDSACTGYRSILAFTALVLAYNKKNKKSKIKAIIIGSSIILFVNILRITSLILYSIKINTNIEFLHNFLWREGLISMVILLWLFWIKN